MPKMRRNTGLLGDKEKLGVESDSGQRPWAVVTGR